MKERHGADGTHEALTEKIIRETQLAETLEKFGQEPDEIASLIRGRHQNKLYNFLLSSDFDVDRVDYLLRDALHTGVSYGYIDVNRLLRTITVDREGVRLAILNKGRQAIENFLIARYHMYQTIYYHKTVAAFELMLKKIYSLLLEETLMPDIDQIFTSEEQFSRFDDHYVWLKMGDYSGSNGVLTELIQMLRRRQPLKVVFEEASLSPDPESVKKHSRLRLLQVPRQRHLLADASGVEEDWIFFLEPPSVYLMARPDEDKAILVEKDGSFVPLIEDKTSIISLLGKAVYLSPRVYTKNDDYKGKVRKGIAECFDI